MRKRLLKLGLWISRLFLVAIFASLLVTFYIVFSPDIRNYFNRVDFNSEVWINWEETESEPSFRWNMVHNLTKKFDLNEMSIEDIKELLGPPNYENNLFLGYNLGMSGHGIDEGVLYINIMDGKVIGFSIWHG